MANATDKQRVPVSEYVSTRVFDGIRQLSASEAARYKERLRKLLASRQAKGNENGRSGL